MFSKKSIGLCIVLCLALALVGCGKKEVKEEATGQVSQKENKKEESIKPEEEKVINIVQFKVEIAEQLEQLKKEYEELNPGIRLEIETIGGGADYSAGLKAKFASGSAPDIFNNFGNKKLDLWVEKLEDLSNEPWVSNLADGIGEQISRDGKLYGLPLNIEGYGFIYNKELFQKAGIAKVPDTLEALEEACIKLEAIGIQPFSNGYQETWVLGGHNFNAALARQSNPKQFITDVIEGKESISDNDIFHEWINLLDLTIKHGTKNAITTDYNTQVTDFATGKAAMMQQGNWTQYQLDKINPDLSVGLLPLAINNTPDDRIYVGVPSNWVVNKESKVKQEAKDLLNWMVSTERGLHYVVNEFKFIPPVKNVDVDASVLGDIAESILDKTSAKGQYSWYDSHLPKGAKAEIGSAMQQYVAGMINKDELFEMFDMVIRDTAEKAAANQ